MGMGDGCGCVLKVGGEGRAGQGGRAIVCPLVVEPLPQVEDLGLGVFRVLMSSRSVPTPMFHFEWSTQRRR